MKKPNREGRKKDERRRKGDEIKKEEEGKIKLEIPGERKEERINRVRKE